MGGASAPKWRLVNVSEGVLDAAAGDGNVDRPLGLAEPAARHNHCECNIPESHRFPINLNL